MASFAGKDVKKLKAKGGGKWKYMSESDMLAQAEPFAPYRYERGCAVTGPDTDVCRSLFMWYMWRVEDVAVDAMDNVK